MKVAAELLASLEEAEEDVERAWAAEIVRRAAEARTDLQTANMMTRVAVSCNRELGVAFEG